MVKNTKGGSGAKGLARKVINSGNSGTNKLRLIENPLEMYAIVDKLLGNCMCNVITHTGLKLLCTIRKKFSGRNKRNNTVLVGSYVLVGLREWETDSKKCDLILIYDNSHTDSLMLFFPHINDSPFDNNLIIHHTIIDDSNTNTTIDEDFNDI